MKKYILELEVIDLDSFMFITKYGNPQKDYLVEGLGLAQHNKQHYNLHAADLSYYYQLNQYSVYPFTDTEIKEIAKLLNENKKGKTTTTNQAPVESTNIDVIIDKLINSTLFKANKVFDQFVVGAKKKGFSAQKITSDWEKNKEKSGYSHFKNGVKLMYWQNSLLGGYKIWGGGTEDYGRKKGSIVGLDKHINAFDMPIIIGAGGASLSGFNNFFKGLRYGQSELGGFSGGISLGEDIREKYNILLFRGYNDTVPLLLDKQQFINLNINHNLDNGKFRDSIKKNILDFNGYMIRK